LLRKEKKEKISGLLQNELEHKTRTKKR